MRKKILFIGISVYLILFGVYEPKKTEEQIVIIENSKLFSEKIEQICTKENVTFYLHEATPFEWDSVYFCDGYAYPSELYEVSGYEWDTMSEFGNEGIIRILFMNESKVVCFVNGSPYYYPKDFNYFFQISISEINKKTISYYDYPKFEVTKMSDPYNITHFPLIEWIGNFPPSDDDYIQK